MKEIKLTQGRVALVDDEDFEYLIRFNWFAHKKSNSFYAIRNAFINGKNKSILMHREILGLSNPKTICDHINGDGLNNQRSNLRIATSCQNSQNRRTNKNSTSKYLGVYRHSKNNKWIAGIASNKKAAYLGSFSNEADAAIAYNKEAKKRYGDFAKLNIII